MEAVPERVSLPSPTLSAPARAGAGGGFGLRWSLLSLLLIAVLLVVGEGVGDLLARQSKPFGLLWPMAGVLLASLLLQPRTMWPWILGIGFGVAMGFDLAMRGAALAHSVLSGVGTAAQGLLGAALVQGAIGNRTPELGRFRDFLSLLVVALIAPLAQGSTEVLLAMLGREGSLAFAKSFPIWWSAQALGTVVAASLVLAWGTAPELRKGSSILRWVELSFAFAGLCFAAMFVFGESAPGQDLALTFPFFAIPFLFWIALRFRLRATATAVTLLALFTIMQITREGEPLAMVGPDGAGHAMIVQAFLSVSIISSLLLASSMADRRRNEDRILALNHTLEDRLGQGTTALAASERRFQALAAAAPVGIFTSDRDGVCRYVNDRWCKLTGQKGGEAIGLRWLDVIDPRDLELIERKWELTRLEAKPLEGEFRLSSTGPGGETLWIYVQVTPDRSVQDGNGFIGSLTDISQRKAAEAASERSRVELEERVKERTSELSRALAQIRESEERVRAVIDSASDAFIATDLEGHIVDWNPEASDILGLTREEAMGRLVIEVLLPAEGGESVRPGFSKLFATGTSPLLRHPIEFQARRANGQTFPAEMTVSAAGEFDSRLFSIFLRDITERKHAEDAVRESESVLRSFFDSTPMMMGLVELLQDDVLHISANSAAARFYDTTPGSMAGRRSAELGLSNSERMLWMSYYRDSQRLGAPQQFEYRAETPQGPRQLSVTVCYATQSANGRPQFAWAAEDITERRLAAEDLREKTEALENAAEGVARIDSQGRIISVNRAYADLTGFENEDLVGREWLCTTHPADRAKLKVAYQTMLGQGKAEQEVKGIRKDGETFYQQQVIVSTYDHTGAFIGHYCFVRDITSRARAEAERDRFFTMSLDMLCIAGFNGYFRRLNPAFEKMLGFSIAELQAAPLAHFVHPEDREATEEMFQTMVAGREAVGFENRFRCKDGTYRWFSWTGTPFAEEQIIYAVAHDVTEQKRVAAEIIASLEEKDVLLKEIHHRVKNNLQVISSLLQLQSGYIKDQKTLETFRESQNRIRSMAMIHEKLYQTESLARIDFEEYATSLSAMLIRSYATTSGVQLRTNIEKVDLNLDTAVPIGLITNELLSNAMKYAFPEGREGIVTVALKKVSEGKYELKISDNGIGLPADLQVEKAKSLGLRLVRILTGQIGGQLDFTSSSSGTTFTVNFSDVE